MNNIILDKFFNELGISEEIALKSHLTYDIELDSTELSDLRTLLLKEFNIQIEQSELGKLTVEQVLSKISEATN